MQTLFKINRSLAILITQLDILESGQTSPIILLLLEEKNGAKGLIKPKCPCYSMYPLWWNICFSDIFPKQDSPFLLSESTK